MYVVDTLKNIDYCRLESDNIITYDNVRHDVLSKQFHLTFRVLVLKHQRIWYGNQSFLPKTLYIHFEFQIMFLSISFHVPC